MSASTVATAAAAVTPTIFTTPIWRAYNAGCSMALRSSAKSEKTSGSRRARYFALLVMTIPAKVISVAAAVKAGRYEIMKTVTK